MSTKIDGVEVPLGLLVSTLPKEKAVKHVLAHCSRDDLVVLINKEKDSGAAKIYQKALLELAKDSNSRAEESVSNDLLTIMQSCLRESSSKNEATSDYLREVAIQASLEDLTSCIKHPEYYRDYWVGLALIDAYSKRPDSDVGLVAEWIEDKRLYQRYHNKFLKALVTIISRWETTA